MYTYAQTLKIIDWPMAPTEREQSSSLLASVKDLDNKENKVVPC